MQFWDFYCSAVGETTIEPGERLVLFSDGVIERRDDDGAEFGRAGLVAALSDGLLQQELLDPGARGLFGKGVERLLGAREKRRR